MFLLKFRLRMWSYCIVNWTQSGYCYYGKCVLRKHQLGKLIALSSCPCCLTKRHVLGSICCVALYKLFLGLIGYWLWGHKSLIHSGLYWEVVPVVICLVLVPGKLPGNVAGRRKNMSNVLKIVWLCLKTKTRPSLRNSRPSKIFIAIKQSNCLWLGPCLL